MLTSLLIATTFLFISMVALLNFERLYRVAEALITSFVRLAHILKTMIDALGRAYRRSNRIPHYS